MYSKIFERIDIVKTDGWVYQCKECGGHHLIPCSTLNEPKETLKIKCPHENEGEGKEYEKTCFSKYSGYWTAEIIEQQCIQ